MSSENSISTCIQTVNEFHLTVKGKKKPTGLNSIYWRKEFKLINSYAVFFSYGQWPYLTSHVCAHLDFKKKESCKMKLLSRILSHFQNQHSICSFPCHRQRQLCRGSCLEWLTAKDRHAALALVFACLCQSCGKADRLAGAACEGGLQASGEAVTICLQTMHECTEDRKGKVIQNVLLNQNRSY